MEMARSTYMNTLVGYSCFILNKLPPPLVTWKQSVLNVCFCSTGDMYTPENGESEPDWVQTERKHFSEFRDANKVKAAQLFKIGVLNQF